MSKIKKITVSNLKAVSKLSADFNGCTAIITGGNNKGKSSFLKSLPDRIRGIKADEVVKHGEKEGFAELELTSGVKFKWEFAEGKDKLTYISDKNIKGSVTKAIAGDYFPKSFDVDKFLNDTPAKQKAELQRLTGLDFTEIDAAYTLAYQNRTAANTILKNEQAKAMPIKELPAEEKDYSELEKELAGIDAHNDKYEMVKRQVNEKVTTVVDNCNEIKRLQEIIKGLEEKNISLDKEIEAGNIWIEDSLHQPKNNQESIKLKIDLIKDDNEEIRENNKAKEQKKVIEQAEYDALVSDKAVKKIEADKLEMIRLASMPEGFGFSETGITYKGFEFTREQLSSSGIYIAALKLAAITLGEVKALHFDASFLDKSSLLEIEQWANENDLQLLIERPDFEGGEIEYQILDISKNQLKATA